VRMRRESHLWREYVCLISWYDFHLGTVQRITDQDSTIVDMVRIRNTYSFVSKRVLFSKTSLRTLSLNITI
jgi:hypothetical protein